MNELSELLAKVDYLFGLERNQKPKLQSYCYSLGRFPYGWQFNVVDSWQKWMDAGFNTNFGVYYFPEYAVQAFLNYVQENHIDAKSLRDAS